MIHPPPVDIEFLINGKSDINWTDWFEDVEHHVNRGEVPRRTLEVEATVGILTESEGTNLLIRVISATSGNVNITANPQIEYGFDGQVITVAGTDNTRTVQLDNDDGLKLANGTSFILGEDDVITFHFNGNKKLWIEHTRSNNS